MGFDLLTPLTSWSFERVQEWKNSSPFFDILDFPYKSPETQKNMYVKFKCIPICHLLRPTLFLLIKPRMKSLWHPGYIKPYLRSEISSAVPFSSEGIPTRQKRQSKRKQKQQTNKFIVCEYSCLFLILITKDVSRARNVPRAKEQGERVAFAGFVGWWMNQIR